MLCLNFFFFSAPALFVAKLGVRCVCSWCIYSAKNKADSSWQATATNQADWSALWKLSSVFWRVLVKVSGLTRRRVGSEQTNAALPTELTGGTNRDAVVELTFIWANLQKEPLFSKCQSFPRRAGITCEKAAIKTHLLWWQRF